MSIQTKAFSSIQNFDIFTQNVWGDGLPYLTDEKIPPVSTSERQIYDIAKKFDGTYQGTCIGYVKKLLDYRGTFGDARVLKPNKYYPEVGDTILMGWNAKITHGAYLLWQYRNEDGKHILVIADSNGNAGQGVADVFELEATSPLIKGFHSH